MPDYSASGNFTATAGANSYRLEITARTSQVDGGTLVESFAQVVKFQTHGTVTTSGTGTRAWNLPGGRSGSTSGTADNNGSSNWPYSFAPSAPITVNVYNFFNRYIPYSYGSSTTLSITASGVGSGFLTSRTVSVNVPLFTLPSYTLSYDSNGGTPTPSSLSRTEGQTFTAASAPTRTGFSFNWWNGSDGQTYFAGTSYSMPAQNLTLTASWSADLPPAPSRPTSLTATSDRTDGVNLVYSGASGDITNYGIFWSTSQTATPSAGTSATFTDTASPFLDTGMTQGSTRYYWIRAQGPGGNSSWFPTTNGISGFRAFVTPAFTDTTLGTSLKLFKSYSDQVTATNAASYSVFTTGAPNTASLPPGLTLNTSTGAITGTPTTQGVYSFRIEASPGAGGPVVYSPSGTTWHTLTVGPNGTRVGDSLEINPLTTARRFDGTSWVNLSLMRRFDGTTWQNILNE